MTKNEKRVVIAKDALAQLRAGTMKVRAGIFCILPKQTELCRGGQIEFSEKTELREVLLYEPCEVCLVGSLFVSVVRRFNRLPANVAFRSGRYGDKPCSGWLYCAGDNKKRLTSYFTYRQLAWMEHAFELDNTDRAFDPSDILSGDEKDRAMKFGMRYETEEKRLAGILRNVVRNGGQFKP